MKSIRLNSYLRQSILDSVKLEFTRNFLRREIKPILESFNTTKQLLDTWPSMEKFLPPNIANPEKGINLPALNLSRLEQKIGGSL